MTTDGDGPSLPARKRRVEAEVSVPDGDSGQITSNGYATPDETNAWLKARKRARRTAEIARDPTDDRVVPCESCGDTAVTTYQRDRYICAGCG